jgi:hypothetical protein
MAHIFPAQARLELIDGKLLEMSPVGPKHIEVVNNLDELLHAAQSLASTSVCSRIVFTACSCLSGG